MIGVRSAKPRETLSGRWKTLIGLKLNALTFNNQKIEANIYIRVLNLETQFGRPKFERLV